VRGAVDKNFKILIECLQVTDLEHVYDAQTCYIINPNDNDIRHVQ
jgi:hypothetical protein